MRNIIALTALACLFNTADEFGTNGGGATPGETPPRENATPGSVLTIDGVVFTFVEEPDPADLFQVLIGATADETDANLAAAIQRAAEFVPADDRPQAVAPAGATAVALEVVADEPVADTPAAPPLFSEIYPAIGEWFDRVQKWAQFEGRPIPEISDAFVAAFANEEMPVDAAARLCQGKTDYATANKQGA